MSIKERQARYEYFAERRRKKIKSTNVSKKFKHVLEKQKLGKNDKYYKATLPDGRVLQNKSKSALLRDYATLLGYEVT